MEGSCVLVLPRTRVDERHARRRKMHTTRVMSTEVSRSAVSILESYRRRKRRSSRRSVIRPAYSNRDEWSCARGFDLYFAGLLHRSGELLRLVESSTFAEVLRDIRC